MKRLLLLLLSPLWGLIFLSAQTVTGTVTSNVDGTTLGGATVRVQGTAVGAFTDENGRYRVEAAGDAVLLVSFFGFDPQEVAVQNRSEIDISLVSSTYSLDDVVVIGYGTARKRDLTGSVTSISEKDIKAVPVVSIDQALQGRAAGVFVQQNSGEPGAATTIRIRGTSSISAGNEPLYVIDGIPILTGSNDISSGAAKGPQLNPLSTINPNDIVSIEVLKDASAAAIYGARAANGVVLITTRRGTEGLSRIEFGSYTGWQEVRNRYQLLDASQFAHFVNEANYYAGNGRVYDNPETFGKGTDWQDEIFRVAPLSSYDLSFSGGTKNLQYAVSGGYYDQDGVIVSSAFKRYNVRANIDGKISDRFRITNSLMASHTRSSRVATDDNAAFDGGMVTGALSYNPLLRLRDEAGNYTAKNFVVDNNGEPIDGTQTDAAGNSIAERTLNTLANPVLKLVGSPSVSKISRIIENFAGIYTLSDGLEFKVSLGADFASSRDDQFTPKATRSGGESFASSGTVSTLTLLSENTLSFKKTFGKHAFNAVGGFSAQKTDINSLNVAAIDFNNDLFGYNNYDIARGADINTNFSDFVFYSYLARVNYIFDNKYLFTLTGRADGSSKFGQNNKWGYFPSVSVGWQLSEEPFIKNLNLFSSLKLRASYGVIGNESIGPYLSQALLVPVQLVFNNQIALGFEPFIFPNSDLRWESTAQLDIGIDASLFKDRFSVTADYYQKNTFDLLLTTDVPFYTGFSNVFSNVGDLRNEGVEFAFTSYNFVSAFQWTTSFNIAFNENTITNLAGRDNIPNTNANLFGIQSWALLTEGEAVGRFYGLLTDGIFQIGESAEGTPRFAGEPPLQPGDRKFKDLNQDGVINDEDRTFIGHAQPDFTFGLNNTFSWKGFDVGVFVQGVYGNEIVNFNKFLIERVNPTSNVSLEFYANRWTPENPSNVYPRVNADPALSRPYISDAEVEDGSYLRVKTLTLGYTLPARIVERLRLAKARIYGTGKNLYTWTDYSGFDPEVSHFGQDASNLGADLGGFPNTQSFLVGIELGF